MMIPIMRAAARAAGRAAGEAKRNNPAVGRGLYGANPVSTLVFVVLLIGSIILAAILAERRAQPVRIIEWVAGINLVGLYILLAFRVAKQWEKAIVLRLGKFKQQDTQLQIRILKQQDPHLLIFHLNPDLPISHLHPVYQLIL